MIEPAVSLAGKTLLITGGSRGIGLAIGLRAARDGANVALAAKTVEPHPRLPGTLHTAAAEIEAAGGQALVCPTDVRFEEQIRAAVEATVSHFGRLDILVNNAGAIDLSPTESVTMKRFDLMHGVNVRAAFAASQAALPHLAKASNAHILMLSPPLNLEPRFFAPQLAYSLSKFGMSLCVLGLAEEQRDAGIAVNALWPKTVIATAAVQNLLGGDAIVAQSRQPAIVADAAHWIFTQPSRGFTGNFCLDEEVLRSAGVTDFERYAMTPGAELFPDLFVL